MRQVYFDNGSTSFPKAPGVGDAIKNLMDNGAFNINRGNYDGAYEIEASVLDTRERLCALFGAENSRQVIFTPGITYSLNYFIKGFLKQGDHVLVTSMEHNAVMRPLRQMQQYGVSYDVIQADEEGNISAGDFEKAVSASTKAVIVLHASNVCGTVVPIREIGSICRQRGLYFAVDTAQTAGSIEVDMKECGIDFLAFTGHKGLLGPQGIGGFLISERLNQQMKPYIAGGTGSQSDLLEMPGYLPDKYESGTLNIPGIIGLNAALSYIESSGGVKAIHEKKMELTEQFINGLKSFSGVRIAGRQDCENRTAVVSVDFAGMDNAVAAFELENTYGIMTRVGLHCAPLAHKTLHTYPQGTVRFAFSAFNTKEEVQYCLKALQTILHTGEIIH